MHMLSDDYCDDADWYCLDYGGNGYHQRPNI